MLILIEKGDIEAEQFANIIIEESGDWIDLPRGYKVRYDKAYINRTQDHTHVFRGNRQIAVINRDGTSSHNSDLSLLPNRILRELKKRNFVESSMNILEASSDQIYLPTDVLKALFETIDRRAKYMRLMRNIGHKL